MEIQPTKSRNKFRTAVRLLAHILVALIIASILGSLVQSQLNLLAIARMTGGLTIADWLGTYWFDLRHFAPMLAAIFLPVLLVSLAIASLLAARLPRARYPVYFFTPALLLYAALTIINALAPMPTLIAANRDLTGTLLLMSSLGLGAMVFACLRSSTKGAAS